MNLGSSDSGNVALEVIGVGVLGSILVTIGALTMFSAQRDSFAAEELARQGVRAAALGWASSQIAELASVTATNLHLDDSDVDLKVQSLDGVEHAEARVRQSKATAAMRVNQ